jgi:uncharacterized protein YjbI with pentapeptide repeats
MNWVGELAVALVGSGAVALCVLIVERHYDKKKAKRDLEHMLGTGDNFVGIDLRGRDLSGSYLAGKNFSGAKFDGADLRGANLSGTVLSWASFADADLRGASFSATMLTPSEYLYPSDNLAPGAIAPGGEPLKDANLQAVTLTGAKFDATTEWPDNFDPVRDGAQFIG